MSFGARVMVVLGTAVLVAAVLIGWRGTQTGVLDLGGGPGSPVLPHDVAVSTPAATGAQILPTLPSPTVTPSSPRTVCGDASLLDGPSTPPSGAVTVEPGGGLPALVQQYPAGHVTFWLAPGTYTLGSTSFSQVIPATGDTFVGAPGAVIDGQGLNDYAFTQQATDVTIEYLTIEGFEAPRTQGVVNHDSGQGWVIEHDTVRTNAGAGVMLGSDDVLADNCLTDNGQYGFSAYSATGVSNLTVEGNEISGNDTHNWTATTPGCGCAGGAKFWETDGAAVVDNYVHDNEQVGLWADTNNVGFDFSGNYISGNYAEGIVYEISYNALISHNAFVQNALGVGPTNPGFPDGAIYVSNSGADSRVKSAYDTSLTIADNLFSDNWSGVVLWDTANRFCGSPDNTSSGACTLVTPPAINLSTCTEANLAHATPTEQPVDYYDDCRWKTQDVSVANNTFDLTRAAIGSDCTAAESCGLQGLFSEYGTSPSWSPYQGEVIEQAITHTQHDQFVDNVYEGSWEFMVHDQSQVVSLVTWQDTWGQDAGSTQSTSSSGGSGGSGGTTTTTKPPPTTTTTTTTQPPPTTTTTTKPPPPPTTTTTTQPPPTTTTTTKPPPTTTTTQPSGTTTTTSGGQGGSGRSGHRPNWWWRWRW